MLHFTVQRQGRQSFVLGIMKVFAKVPSKQVVSQVWGWDQGWYHVDEQLRITVLTLTCMPSQPDNASSKKPQKHHMLCPTPLRTKRPSYT